MKPYPHQDEGVTKALVSLKEANRIQIISACGTGKTAMECWIVEKYKAKINVIVVPSRALVVQFGDDFINLKIPGFKILLVFSDTGVSLDDEFKINPDELNHPSTTDQKEIESFLKQKDQLLIISTYKSAHRVGAACQELNKKIDLLISDEAHNTAGTCESYFKDVLYDDFVPALRRVFFTATPKIRYARKTKTDMIKVNDMSNHVLYGEVIYEYTYKQALKDKIVVPIKLIVLGIKAEDERYLNQIKNEYTLNFHADAITKIAKEMEIDKLIVYKNFIVNCENLAELLENKGINHDTNIITGFQNAKTKKSKLKNFKDRKKSILLNHRCLSEGINLPCINAVYISDPIKNQIAISQIMGRASRKYPNKKFGYVIIPVMINENITDKHRLLSISDFTSINEAFNVLFNQGVITSHDIHLAYKNQDEWKTNLKNILDFHNIDVGIEEYIKAEIVEYNRDNWYVTADVYINFLDTYNQEPPKGSQLYNWIRVQKSKNNIGNLEKEKVDYLISHGIIMQNTNRNKAWYRKADALIEYVKKKQEIPPPSHILGAFLLRQKHHKNTKQLSKEREKYLIDNGISLEKIDYNTIWYKNALKFDAYVKKHGKIPPRKHRLGSWYHKQRDYKGNYPVPPERKKFLSDLGYDLSPTNYNEKWFIQADELGEFLKNNGHLPLPGHPLNKWYQRQLKEHNKDQLSKKRVDYLNDLGIQLISPLEMSFYKFLNQLKEYIDQNNKYPPAKSKLGQFLIRTQKKRNENTLSKKHLKSIKKYDIDLDKLSRTQSWYNWCNKAINYYKKHNKFPSTRTPVGQWLQRQRNSINKNVLSQKQMTYLYKYLPMDDFGYDAFLKKRIREFTNYIKENEKFPPNNSILGKWWLALRHQYKNDNLSKHIIRTLLDNGLDLNITAFDYQWYKNADALINYIKKYKSYPPPGDTLDTWLKRQKRLNRKNKLKPDRKMYLLEHLNNIL